eukprot:TRINITY_DN725_c0_g9_i2.p1 TRINITY_DN725_c0_g9~~TRINITY_DN725_c0_g9_i2.p1  ORF type:complete len:253 (+),score=-13.13 TRINITY_DN725_c0_g9_i2:74-760(+)
MKVIQGNLLYDYFFPGEIYMQRFSNLTDGKCFFFWQFSNVPYYLEEGLYICKFFSNSGWRPWSELQNYLPGINRMDFWSKIALNWLFRTTSNIRVWFNGPYNKHSLRPLPKLHKVCFSSFLQSAQVVLVAPTLDFDLALVANHDQRKTLDYRIKTSACRSTNKTIDPIGEIPLWCFCSGDGMSCAGRHFQKMRAQRPTQDTTNFAQKDGEEGKGIHVGKQEGVKRYYC